MEEHGMALNSLEEVGSPSLFPYSSCGLLLMEFTIGIFIGTAFQISPYEILSCAHNFYQRGYYEEARKVCYVPAANGFVDFEAMQGIRVSPFMYPKEFQDCKFEDKDKY